MKLKKEKYYTLKEILSLVDLKERALKYRMLRVKNKYKNNNKLLYKKGRNWNIHESIVFEFDRKKKSKIDDDFHKQSFVSVSPDGNYSIESMVEVINETYRLLKHLREGLKIRYYIEQGLSADTYHLHFIVNLSSSYGSVIKRASEHFIAANIDIRPVFLERNLIMYLEKEVKTKGVINNYVLS